MPSIEDILKLIGINGGLICIVLCVGAIIYMIYQHHKLAMEQVLSGRKNAGLIRLQKSLRYNSLQSKYRLQLQNTVDFFDKKFGTEEFGTRSLDFFLKLPIIYIPTSLIISWLFSNANTSGIEGFLPNTMVNSQRGILAICLTLIAILYCDAMRRTRLEISQTGKIRIPRAAVFELCLAFLLFPILSYLGIGALATIIIIAIGFGFFGPWTYPGHASIAYTSIGTFIFLGLTSPLVIPALIVLGPIIFVMYLLYRNLSVQKNESTFWQSAFLIGFIILNSLLYLILFTVVSNPEAIAILVFCIIFPLINAQFDFVSFAVSRKLLKEVLLNNSPSISIAKDIIIAIILIFSLILVWSTIALLISISSTGFFLGIENMPFKFDGITIFKKISDNPLSIQLLWIYFGLITVLLPTLVHVFCISISIFFLTTPSWLKEKVLKETKSKRFHDDPQMKMQLTYLLTARDSVGLITCTLFIVILYYLSPTALWWSYQLMLDLAQIPFTLAGYKF